MFDSPSVQAHYCCFCMLATSSDPHGYKLVIITWNVMAWITVISLSLNLSDYLANDTTLSLIFLPGKHSLESDLIVENVHSFSMYTWPGSSSKVEITCGHKTRFEFSNVSTVTVSGLEFTGCFQNHVITVP